MHLFMTPCLLHLFPRVSLIFTSQFAPCYTNDQEARCKLFPAPTMKPELRPRERASRNFSREARDFRAVFHQLFPPPRLQKSVCPFTFLSALDERRGAARRRRENAKRKERKKKRREKGREHSRSVILFRRRVAFYRAACSLAGNIDRCYLPIHAR